jgi:hypothetical protein
LAVLGRILSVKSLEALSIGSVSKLIITQATPPPPQSAFIVDI